MKPCIELYFKTFPKIINHLLKNQALLIVNFISYILVFHKITKCLRIRVPSDNVITYPYAIFVQAFKPPTILHCLPPTYYPKKECN